MLHLFWSKIEKNRWVRATDKVCHGECSNQSSTVSDEKDANQRLLAYVSGAEWQNIVALELSYHRSCYTNLIRKDNRRSSAADSQDPAIEKLFESIKAIVLQKCELVFLNKLPNLYGGYSDNVPDKRTLADLVIKHFDGQVAIWSPKYGNAFLFNNELEKGKIIELLFQKVDKIKKKKNQSLKEQIKSVAKAVKKEVSNVRDTLSLIHI